MLQINGTTMNNDKLFYSADLSNNSIEAHTVNLHTNKQCMNNIVKVCLSNFQFFHDNIQILHTYYGIKLLILKTVF